MPKKGVIPTENVNSCQSQCICRLRIIGGPEKVLVKSQKQEHLKMEALLQLL